MGYDMRCTSCDSTWVHEGDKFSLMDVYDDPCPSCGVVGCVERGYVQENREGFSTATIDTNRLAFRKKDGGFQELLSKIHEGSPGSKLDKKL